MLDVLFEKDTPDLRLVVSPQKGVVAALRARGRSAAPDCPFPGSRFHTIVALFSIYPLRPGG